MTPLDALAEAMDTELALLPIADRVVFLPLKKRLARACLRAIGEGKVVTREKIVKALSDKYGRLPDGSPYPSVLEMADALLALFREAGE